jgi:steroid 5-alpha reductase family enzyme
MIWATRIAGFLLFRVLKTGTDSRFDDIRNNFFKFLAFWIGQIIWVWTVSLPLIILNSPAISNTNGTGSNPRFGTARDIVGIVLWTIGWVVETVADAEKFRYKSSNPPKDQPITKGLWGWSRHPPYFGEILCWWGIWTLCLSPASNGDLLHKDRAAQYGAIVSPLFTMLLLLFASGIPTAEKPTAKKFFLMSNGPNASHSSAWRNYQDYLNRTSILIPIPPALYKPLPAFLKKTVLFDFPFYNFNEKTDGVEALEQEHKRMAQGD